MLVGLIKDKYCYKNDYLNLYKKVLDYNLVKNIILDVSQIDFWEKINVCNLVIFRWGHYDSDRQIAQTILPIIENHLKIKCFPDQATCWHFDDKIKQYYLLKSLGYPYIKTAIFWDKKSALNWVEKANFPVVFKLKGGAGSKNVKKIKNPYHAKKTIKKMFGGGMNTNSIDRNKISLKREIKHFIGNILRKYKGEGVDTWQKERNYVMFQKFLPKNDFDTRITVIGNRAFAFIRYTREGDFRASGSGCISYDKELIDIRAVKMALEISKKMDFQSMAFDFLFNEKNEPEFCEISYTYEDKAVYNCSGYWDENLEWHEGHFLPQYWHLVDLLENDNLKQPEIIG